MQNFISTKFILLFVLLIASSLTAESLNIEKAKKEFSKCSSQEASFSLVDLILNKQLLSINQKLKLKPASVQKLLTSFIALDKFGINYKFETKFYAYQDGKSNYLVVKGYGDPSITEKALWEIVHVIKRKTDTKFNKIILDDSAFIGNIDASGQRAFEAGTSALSFNYNSVLLETCPTKVNRKAKTYIEPSELKASFNGQIKTQGGFGNKLFIDNNAEDFSYKIRGYIGSKSSCDENYRSVKEPIKYFGLLLGNYLQYLDLADDLKIEKKKISFFSKFKLKEIFTHKSKPLSEIINDLHLYSNNMLAEHILMLLGKDGETFRRNLGIKTMKDFLLRKGYTLGSFEINDSSGLSHENRISSKILIEILKDAHANPSLFPEYLASLPVAGVSGTLKKRFTNSFFRKKSISIRAKTGTLTGVSSLAGYILKNKSLYAFSFIQNRTVSKTTANRCEEKTLLALLK